ncbi:hypothetical protein [Humibacter sp.]|uniref:hypothetical protein n=1 Tax=Humibacter sp. TaxID=1940291 RepID=UPI003F7E835C
MNTINQRIADRWTMLGILAHGDHWATAAVERHDAIALLRRIRKANLADATHYAVEAALMRGHGHAEIMRAAGLTTHQLREHISVIYALRSRSNHERS